MSKFLVKLGRQRFPDAGEVWAEAENAKEAEYLALDLALLDNPAIDWGPPATVSTSAHTSPTP